MELVTPKVTQIFQFQGIKHRWIEGRTLIEKGHPILRGREDLVQPVRVDYPLEPKVVRDARGEEARGEGKGEGRGVITRGDSHAVAPVAAQGAVTSGHGVAALDLVGLGAGAGPPRLLAVRGRSR